MALIPSSKSQALLDAQLVLWQQAYSFVKSMALKAALDLHVADAIHGCGGTATLPQIATKTKIHQSKLSHLRRLMRVLTVTGVFSVEQLTDSHSVGEHVYGLTPASRLMVNSTSTMSLSPLLTLAVDCVNVLPLFGLAEWFQHELPDPNLFKMAHGQNVWDLAGCDRKFANLFDNAMAADSGFAMDIVIKECAGVFHGISSLIDVAGGYGGASQAISKAFPHIKCSVLDLQHVVDAAPIGTEVTYIAGDMFQSIPPADVVLLKWVLHDWGDAECVQILRNCREAIPPRYAGGKVIIVDMVVGTESSDQRHRETQLMFDLLIMYMDGMERDEQGWKKIFLEAGFSDYKFIHVLGLRSIIEVYP